MRCVPTVAAASFGASGGTVQRGSTRDDFERRGGSCLARTAWLDNDRPRPSRRVLPETHGSRRSFKPNLVRAQSNRNRSCYLERQRRVYRSSGMQNARPDCPGCVCLHPKTSARRKCWRCWIVAGHRRNPGFASRRASTCASWSSNDPAADFGFAYLRGNGRPRNRFKLWNQSANRRFAAPKGFGNDNYLGVSDPMIPDPVPHRRQLSGSQRKPLLTLQKDLAAVPSASPMRKPVLLLVALLASADFIIGAIRTPENAPVEITSTGETTYENNLATARDNVAIHVGDTDIYADYARYNSNTHDVELRGHVRIYRGVTFYLADSGVYNVDTKKVRAINGQTESVPYFLSGESVTEISENAFLIKNGT